MVVRTNVLALNAHRNLGMTGLQQSRSSARLSSGFRINSAADDAAGLGISEKMRAQIRGLDQAARNAQDGISLIQTAEGAMGTINDMVKRIRDLVVQAANDTNAHLMQNEATWSQSDRTRIQDEINQLLAEIDGTVERTEFNTRRLLDGSLAAGSDAETGKVANGDYNPGASAIVRVGDQWVLNQAAFENVFNANFNIDVTDKMNAWAVEQGAVDFDAWIAANAGNVGTTVNTVVAPFSPAQVAEIINLDNQRDPAVVSDFGTLENFLNGLIKSDEFAAIFKTMGIENAEDLMKGITLSSQTNFVNALNGWGGLNGNAALGTQMLVHLDNWANQYIVNGGDIVTAETRAGAGQHYLVNQIGVGVGGFAVNNVINNHTVVQADLDEAGALYGKTIQEILAAGATLTISGAATVDVPANAAINNVTLRPVGDHAGAVLTIGDSINGVQVTEESIDEGGFHHTLFGGVGLIALTSEGSANSITSGGTTGTDPATALRPGQDLNGHVLTPDDLHAGGVHAARGITGDMTIAELLAALDDLDGTAVLALGAGTSSYAAIPTVGAAHVREEGQFVNFQLKAGDWFGVNATSITQVTEASLRGPGIHHSILGLTDADDGRTLNFAGPLVEGAGFFALIGRSEFQGAYGVDTPGSVHLSFLQANATAQDESGGPVSIAERMFDVLAAAPEAARNDLIAGGGVLADVMAMGNFTDNRKEIVEALAGWLKDEFGGFAGAAFIYGIDVTPDNAFTVDNMIRALAGNPDNDDHDGQGMTFNSATPNDAQSTRTRNLAENLINAFDAWARDFTSPAGQSFDDFAEWTTWAFSGSPGSYFTYDSVENKLNHAANGATISSIIPEFAEEETAAAVDGGQLWFQIGANAGQGVQLNIESVNVAALSAVGERGGVESGFNFADLRSDDTTFASRGQGVMKVSGEDISKYLTAIDFALSHATSQRSNLGAMQNRLEFTIENLQVSSENLSAAESRIRDADMAKEMMRFTQSNILQQAAISMLAQANQAPNMLLSLLR